MEGSKWLLVLAILFVVYQMTESTPAKDPCPGDEVRLSNGQCGPCPAGSLRCGKRGPWGDDTGDDDGGDDDGGDDGGGDDGGGDGEPETEDLRPEEDLTDADKRKPSECILDWNCPKSKGNKKYPGRIGRR